MSINSQIIAAVSPYVDVVVSQIYTGDATEYITFNYSELPDDFADDAPQLIRYLIQVHWFLPNGINPMAKKKQIKQALFDAEFTYPSITNASEKDYQHLVFECEGIDGDV